MASRNNGIDLQTMISAVREGTLGRRDFMRLAAGAGIAALATGLLGFPAIAEPKRGGSFRMGIADGSSNDSLDPATWTSPYASMFGPSFFGAGLTEIDHNNSVQPNLAESFESDASATKWMFKLREKLVFHDGRPVRAADVVATYNYHRGENSKSAAKSALAVIANVSAQDERTVVFELKSPYVDFPFLTSDYHLGIFPAKGDDQIEWEKGIGAGPYKLESFQPGVVAKGVRNPDYHKPGLPYFDDVTLLVMNDVTARTSALLSGEIHYMSRCDLKTLPMLRSNPNIEIDNVVGFSHWISLMNTQVAPFNDLNVRLAIKHAINREEIVEKVAFGAATVANDNPIAPTIKYAIDPAPKHGFDPEKARHYLKQAGLDSLTVDLSASDAAFNGAVDVALLISARAAEAGITVNVVREAADGYWDNVWMKKPWCMSTWGGRPTCDLMFETAYASHSSWNDTNWHNARFDELLLAARGELDEEKRAAMYAEMQQLIHDDGGANVIAFSNHVAAHSKAVAHGELNSNFEMDGNRILERWWFV
ncbi:ABC transporter substrate-binding protein [Pseudaminobacter sp. 19-2017]|uniref:ABC transporter substrate-binding protein n=1 Tax=Pseudaminobacter soli (ex Zhang et al. 2022) TaxID=2831468 RepID=A0A942IBY2_9HYPH|nr:ABC transporter substrate-binding protein [Pseudaminobacter soli]MBS3652086.1 ABC transporter substrate-binding protein [Pseudaminobacter soli]